MPPTISAIITSYNYRRFIAGAIDSVLAQTHPPDEILLVDDGSTDDTAARVTRYASRGVRDVYQEHQGVSAARNRGVTESHGDLLAFLDADDRWLQDKLARQLAHLDREPQVGRVTGSEWQVYTAGRPPEYLRWRPAGAVWLYPQILVENRIGNPSLTLIRRTCFARVGGFDEQLPLGQDWDLWMRIAQVCPIGVIDAPLIQYTRHAGSMTAGRAAARMAANRALQRRYIGQVRSPWVRWNWRRQAESMSRYYAAAALLDEPGQHGTARRMALAAAVLDPTYARRLKAGVLFRAWFGQATFAALRRWVPRRSGPAGIKTNSRAQGPEAMSEGREP